MRRIIIYGTFCCLLGTLVAQDAGSGQGSSTTMPKDEGQPSSQTPAITKDVKEIPDDWDLINDDETRGSKDPYAVLGVGPTASIGDVIQAYRTLDTHYRDTPGSDDKHQKRDQIYDAFQAILNPPLPQRPSG